MALYLQDTVHKGEAARYYRLKEMVHHHVGQQIKGQHCELSLMKTDLFKVQQPGEENQQEILKGHGKDLTKDRKHGHCNQWTSLEWRRKKDTSKGKDPKVPVRQESQIIWSALISRRLNAKTNPNAIMGTHQHVPTTNRDVVANGRTSA